MSNIRVKAHPILDILVCTDGHVMVPASRGHTPRWTTGCKGDRGGYLRVTIHGKDYKVHRLILETFVGICPTPNMQCDHINRNPQDNRLENLRWATPSENNRNRKDNDICESTLGIHWYQNSKECYKRYRQTEQGIAAINRSLLKRKLNQKCIRFSNKQKMFVPLPDYDKLIKMDISERDILKYKSGSLL